LLSFVPFLLFFEAATTKTKTLKKTGSVYLSAASVSVVGRFCTKGFPATAVFSRQRAACPDYPWLASSGAFQVLSPCLAASRAEGAIEISPTPALDWRAAALLPAAATAALALAHPGGAAGDRMVGPCRGTVSRQFLNILLLRMKRKTVPRHRF
jgi:hypothetical protein